MSMIRYALRCDKDHGFESWFRDSSAFEDLVKAGALSCPECGSASVSKQIMSPRVSSAAAARGPVPVEAPAPAEELGRTPAVPAGRQRMVASESDKLRLMLRELRRKVEESCDYVGPRFAEEARRIHSGEADPRGIYGEASAEEAEALADEGVKVARIPWISRDDA